MAKRRTWKRDKRGRFASKGGGGSKALARVGIKTKRYKADQARAEKNANRRANRGVKQLLKLEAKELGVDPKVYAAQQRPPKRRKKR